MSVLLIAGSLGFAAASMPAPPTPMIRFAATVNDITDGDTLRISAEVSMAVRLLDCWAPELKTEPGVASKRNLIRLTSRNQRCIVEVPLHDDIGKCTSLGRILGRVYIEGQAVDLSTLQVQGGFATRTKD
jgi:endonuclease YncB( thermonuclease family)